MKRRQVCYGLCITALWWSLPLMAAGEVRLHWRAPSGCPTQADVGRSLARVPGAERLSVDAAVERDGDGYRLRLRVRGEGQRFERDLRAGSCEVLAESAVFLVELAGSQLSAAARAPRDRKTAPKPVQTARAERAVLAEPTQDLTSRDRAESQRPPPEHAEGAQREPEAESSAAAELVSTSAPETTHRQGEDAAAALSGEVGSSGATNLRVGFGVAVTEVGLSGVTPHLALDLSLGLVDWSLGLRLGALLHPALIIAEGAEVDLQTYAAQLLGCRYWEVASVSIGPCAAVSVLRTTAHATGLTGQESSSANWLSAGPALSLQAPVMRGLLLGVEIGMWAALSPRPSFEVGGNTLTRAGTLAGYARLGAAYELW